MRYSQLLKYITPHRRTLALVVVLWVLVLLSTIAAALVAGALLAVYAWGAFEDQRRRDHLVAELDAGGAVG